MERDSTSLFMLIICHVFQYTRVGRLTLVNLKIHGFISYFYIFMCVFFFYILCLYFFRIISYLKYYINFDIFFYSYNFNIIICLYYIHIIIRVVLYFLLYFNYFAWIHIIVSCSIFADIELFAICFRWIPSFSSSENGQSLCFPWNMEQSCTN